MSKPKSEKKFSFFELATYFIPIVIKSSPVFFCLWVISSLLMSAAFVSRTMVTQALFDNVQALYNKEVTMYVPLVSLLIFFLTYVLVHITNWATNLLPSTFFKSDEVSTIKIFKKLGKISPIEFENTDRLDDINKASEGRWAAMVFSQTMIMLLCFYLPYFIFMGWYLMSVKPMFILVIVAAFVPALISQYVNVKIFSKAEDDSAPIRRLSEHYENALVSREYFKETRLLGGYDFFIKLYKDSIQRLNSIIIKSTIKSNMIILCLNIVTCLGIFGILYLLTTSLLSGEITAGAFAAIFNSIFMLFGIMNEIINMHLKQITRSMGKMQNYVSLMKAPVREGDKKAPTGQFDIELKDVSFAYPKASKNALNNINLTIKGGETVAIVGENGSGKSTLIRLVTGLYPPTQGVVLHDGVDTFEISPDELFKNTSAVFQKFTRYQMTLGENVSISDADKEYDEKNLDIAMGRADISKVDDVFTDGYETMLSREFDGIDLSGGVWQRVAIARAFYKEHGLVVLDEPTAAIDPLEETKIYNRFAELSQGKTAIIVTHRLGSVKLADRILVMKESQLVESGTHDELMNADGEYKKMYISQQKQYV